MIGIRLAVGAIGALVVLTGCGGGDKPAASDFADGSVTEIEDAFEADMSKLDSVHIAGTVANNDAEIELDLGLNTAGDCEGTVGLLGGTAEIISLDGTAWMKPDEAFWRASAPDTADAVIAAVGDKWVVVPPSAASLTTICDLNQILDSLTKSDNQESTKAGTDQVDGQDVVKLSREDTNDPDATVTAWIAVDGEHYLLKFEKTGGTEPGSVLLTDFNKELDITPPAADDIAAIS